MQKQIKYIAVDDNLLDILAIEEFAKNHSNLLKIDSFSNASDALLAIKATKPDLVFWMWKCPNSLG